MEDENKETKTTSKRRVDHLANERTFLAWERTALGIIAIGFVLERFSFFVRQMSYLENEGPPKYHSTVFGIVLVTIGAIIGLLAYFKFINVQKEIEEDTQKLSNKLALFLTLFIVVIGIGLLSYLLVS